MSTPTGNRHVHEIDVVRVLTFACVIAVHTVAHTNPFASVSANAVLMLLHFTREAFFFLTGFVLVHTYLYRPVDVRMFYRKRLTTVAVPYVVWTCIYTYLPQHWHIPAASLTTLAENLALGSATYHLYFLLVSLQIYLLYPLIARLLKATAGHHLHLLAVSAVAQLALYCWLTYAPSPSGWLGAVVAHDDALVISYQFYVFAGAVCAYHADPVRTFIAANRVRVAVMAVPAAALALGVYFAAVADGKPAELAAAVLQPVMIVWAMAAVLALFALGSSWSQHRVAGSHLDRVISYGSDRSFGIFLVHPAIIGYVLDCGWVRELPAVSQTVVTYLMVVAGSLIAVEVFRRSPLSLILTGRRRAKETAHASHNARPARASSQAAFSRSHDGDGRWATEQVLH